jgi:hypothetical protein
VREQLTRQVGVPADRRKYEDAAIRDGLKVVGAGGHQ